MRLQTMRLAPEKRLDPRVQAAAPPSRHGRLPGARRGHRRAGGRRRPRRPQPGQPDREARTAATTLAGGFDHAAVQLDEVPGDREAETEAAVTARLPALRLP